MGDEHGNDKMRSQDYELEAIRKSLYGLRYGSITIVVHDGVIVQVDRTEKKRLIKGESGYEDRN